MWYTSYYQDGSQHILQAKAYDKNGKSYDSKFVIVNVYRFKPSYLQAFLKADTLIELTWIDNCKYETGFEIESSVNDSNFIKVSEVDSNITSYNFTGAFNLTDKYYFRVRTKAGTKLSGYSNIASASVMLNVPVDLNIDFISDTAAIFSWTDNNNFETGYVITKYIPYFGNVQIKEVASNITETVIEDSFISGQYYNYSLYAKMGYLNGESAHFPYINFEFPSPYDLHVEGINENSLKLIWKDDNNYELGFIVERSNDGINYVEIGRSSRDNLSIIDNNLDTTYNYLYRIAAFSRYNLSYYSPEISAYYLQQLNPINKFQVMSTISWMTVGYDASITALGGYTSNGVAVYIYDTFYGQHLRTLYSVDSLDRIFEYITISPDNKLVAAAGDNGYVTVWNINSGEVVHRINNLVRPNAMKFSYDGVHLIIERGGTLRFYDIQTWQYEVRVSTSNYIHILEVDLNQSIIVTGDGQSNIKLWDYNSGSLLREIPSTFNAYPLKINKTGTKIYGVRNYELMVWDVGTTSLISTIPNFWGRRNIAINENKDIAAGSFNSQGVGLWKLSNGIYSQLFSPEDEIFIELFFSPDDTKLIGRVFTHYYRIWDIINRWCSPYE